MLTCKSPRKVMVVAHHLAKGVLPDYACKNSRKDFTLPQLFACLAVKELLKRSYREAEAVLRDADPTHFEDRHVSRYFEFRRGRGGGGKGRRKKAKSLPKLAVAVASACHLVVSAWAGAGSGGDGRHFEALLYDAWRRVPNRRFKAAFDAGFDGEHHHELARHDMGVATLIPATIGRPRKGGAPPAGRWRRHMRRLLATARSRRACGYTQRWQAETVNSMIKRNLGSALRGKSKQSRVRDMRLKVLVHNLMILRRRRKVETEQLCPGFLLFNRAGARQRLLGLAAAGRMYRFSMSNGGAPNSEPSFQPVNTATISNSGRTMMNCPPRPSAP